MRYSGNIGFRETVETVPDVWKEVIVEHGPYFGDVLYDGRSALSGSEVVAPVAINNKISIVADPYALSHFWNIVYVTWYGQKWKVSVENQYPRLVLTLGGLYDGPETN